VETPLGARVIEVFWLPTALDRNIVAEPKKERKGEDQGPARTHPICFPKNWFYVTCRH